MGNKNRKDLLKRKAAKKVRRTRRTRTLGERTSSKKVGDLGANPKPFWPSKSTILSP